MRRRTPRAATCSCVPSIDACAAPAYLPTMCRLLPALLLLACSNEPECLRRVDVAHRLAREHLASCTWDPGALVEPDCDTLDRRPIQIYQAVWCSAASQACLRGSAEALELCFGDDTTPESVRSDP